MTILYRWDILGTFTRRKKTLDQTQIASTSDRRCRNDPRSHDRKTVNLLLLFIFFTEVRGAASNTAYYGYPELWILRYPAHRYHAVPSPGFEPTTLWLRVRRPRRSNSESRLGSHYTVGLPLPRRAPNLPFHVIQGIFLILAEAKLLALDSIV
jgi:hypothetical protein